MVSCVDVVGVNEDVGKFVLNVLVPVQVLLAPTTPAIPVST